MLTPGVPDANCTQPIEKGGQNTVEDTRETSTSCSQTNCPAEEGRREIEGRRKNEAPVIRKPSFLRRVGRKFKRIMGIR